VVFIEQIVGVYSD